MSTREHPRLRTRLRRFVLPMVALLLAWHVGYVLLGALSPHLAEARVAGELHVGLIFGMLQFLTAVAIVIWYVRYANRRLDPISREIRARIRRD